VYLYLCTPLVPQEGAVATFMAAKQAYEVLSDPQRRAQYDATLSVRRIGFFRDVVEEEEGAEEGEEGDASNPWTQHRWGAEGHHAAAAAAAAASR
jgi:DnaJ-class molecular chaperone